MRFKLAFIMLMVSVTVNGCDVFVKECGTSCDEERCYNGDIYCHDSCSYVHDILDECHYGCTEVADGNDYCACAPDQFMCNDRSCIPGASACDCKRDCPNGEDEASCDFQRSQAPYRLMNSCSISGNLWFRF